MLTDYPCTVVPPGVDSEPNPESALQDVSFSLQSHTLQKPANWKKQLQLCWLASLRWSHYCCFYYYSPSLYFHKELRTTEGTRKRLVASIRWRVTGSRNSHDLTADPGNRTWLHLGQRKSLPLLNALGWFSAPDIFFLLDSYSNKSL